MSEGVTLEREAFERFVRSSAYPLGLARCLDAYSDSFTSMAWYAWQARANLSQPAQAVDGWQPIETAPTSNKRPLLIASFNDLGKIRDFDFNASWESESESWEIPQVYYFWASENGNVEEPTHWMYQPEWFDKLSATPTPDKE